MDLFWIFQLTWEDADSSETYRYYAVYYKKKDEDDEYKVGPGLLLHITGRVVHVCYVTL